MQITRNLAGLISFSASSFGKNFGVVMAMSVWSLRPVLASSGSRMQPILTPLGPLYYLLSYRILVVLVMQININQQRNKMEYHFLSMDI